ncbi:MAG TPA: ABC transporter ATP-binding protein [Rhizomicrobium sp.]|jgi:lipopolysaccharide transport system ATP-binding protein|nr:ABC transporter ATP-binding protein [Rhizomicrobium sp.]
MSAREIVVEARALGKSYRLKMRGAHPIIGAATEEFWALRNVDLTLARGEALGVIGENGAGKSTLLRLLCGTLRPTTGMVHAEGRIAALLELGAGFNPNFTGRENVWLNAAVLGLSKAEIAERFDAIATFAGIGEFIDLPVRLYSSGMQARLAFAVSAHVDADILIVDEILSVGDAAFAQKCSARLEKFRKSGTLLFVSHNTGTVARLCDRALWLEHGEVRELGPAADVCANYLASLAERAEAEDSKARSQPARRWKPLEPPPLVNDPRQRQRNAIAISPFSDDAPWHGHGGARITDVSFRDNAGTRLCEIEGGTEVKLSIRCHAEREIAEPIVGFMLRDRLGQNVFGDSTYLALRDTQRRMAADQEFVADFIFQLPFLAAGDYGLTAAITQGTQADHTHVHWVEEAVMLNARESPVARGIVGIPAIAVEIEKTTATA